MHNPQCIEKVPQKLSFQTLVFTLLLHSNWIFNFEDTNISDLVSHYFCFFFSQLCSIDLIQASFHNSCAILLVKYTPLLQVCALLGLMFALLPPLTYQQKCNSSRKQTICMRGAIPSIYSQNFIFVNPLPHTL